MNMNVFSKLQHAFESGAFDPFISRIRFPYLKRLQLQSEIKFDYPITAIVGSNGTNKTTILRALEACPAGKSLGDYWFDTSLDSIDTTKGNPRYIHEYRIPSGKMAEVLKVRVARKDRRSDYFETDSPRVNDGMKRMPAYEKLDKEYRTKDRWKPIRKDVLYLDFRAQLPAYDILMSFDWRGGFSSLEDKKSWIRKTSTHLRKALEELSTSRTYYGREKVIEPAVDLSHAEVKAIAKILGKDYRRVRLIKHEYYGCFGWTAILDTNELEYSEAFAGSGEFAVTMLVHALCNAEEKSLILLDEPETSLHPGAQKELLQFIAEETLKRKHQVVMSTHSSAMIEQLPDRARKLLAVDPHSGEIHVVANSASIEESFVRLGATHERKTIIVEDQLAMELVLAAARKRGDDFLQSIKVTVVPGGAESLIKHAGVAYAMKDDDCVILLDGDKRPDNALSDNDVADGDLEAELKKIGIVDKDLLRDGGNGDKRSQITQARRKVFNWMRSHVGYLPGTDCPENLILVAGSEAPYPSPDDAKNHWHSETKRRLGRSDCEKVDAANILQVQQEYIAGLEDASMFDEILATIKGLHGFESE